MHVLSHTKKENLTLSHTQVPEVLSSLIMLQHLDLNHNELTGRHVEWSYSPSIHMCG